MSINWLYYIGLAILSIIQGPVVIIVGAGISATGAISPWGVMIAVTIGNLTADMVWYYIGRLGKIEWVLRLRFLHINMDTIDKLENALTKHAPRIVLLAKLSSVFVLPVMIAIGLLRLDWRRWLPTLVGVEIPKNVLMILIGYYSVVSITQFKNWLAILSVPFIILSIVIPWRLFKRSMERGDL